MLGFALISVSNASSVDGSASRSVSDWYPSLRLKTGASAS